MAASECDQSPRDVVLRLITSAFPRKCPCSHAYFYHPNFITTFNSAAFATYDGVSNISGVAGVVATQPFSFQTDQGAIVINNVTNITFSAAVAADAAVPEPATWGMMLLGFGLAGASMRSRRRRTAVTYA